MNAAAQPAVTASPIPIVVQTSETIEKRNVDPPHPSAEPSLAWVVWISVAFLILLVMLIAISPDREPASIASGGPSIEDRRSADSISVLELVTAGSSMPVERLISLEFTLHANDFPIPHDAAHTRYSKAMLDSADALIKTGLTFQARGLLGSIGNPGARTDSLRAARLNARLVEVEEEQAQESARQQRLAQAQVLEDRIERIRGLQQGTCTPPVRAVRNRVRKNPDWSDEMIATTACNRVHIGMTREQAIAGWGRPRDINRTTGSFGVHEQWVYGEYGSGYLYFEDGRLTTIQN